MLFVCLPAAVALFAESCRNAWAPVFVAERDVLSFHDVRGDSLLGVVQS